jgi:hypothetical protein
LLIRDERPHLAGGPALDPLGGTATYARVASLPVVVERCELLPLVRDTTSGFTKVSIVVRLSGGGYTGEGEDITWDQIDQIEFLRGGAQLGWLHGTRTFDELSALLGLANLFPVEPIRDSAPLYRRWAFESAALDLALRQDGLSLEHVAMPPQAALYRRVIQGLPGAWIEDPAIDDDTAALLEQHRDRISWDEPIRSVQDIEALPWRPRMLNLKPARFGSVRALFDAYDHCAAQGIGAYGGGMFEQGPGRGQLQYLASLFHPDGPNDVAPTGFNLQSPSPDLPRSPLKAEPHPTGFRWGTYDGRRSIREPLVGGHGAE